MIFDDATQAQIDAARPDASTWLTANAGSGKTRVLTDRVARLLLAGVDPQQILCLTYTKAAASEMQNRLFKRLGEWAMRGDAELRSSLVELGIEDKLTVPQLRDARTLFARAIETPGGLKIQTIHSFCAAILRRFPLEAKVSPQFTEIEDRAADLLRGDIVDEMAEGPDAPLVAGLAQHYTGEDFSKLTKSIISMRDLFTRNMTLPDILGLLDLPLDLTPKSIEDAVFNGDEDDIIARIVPPMLAKGGNDANAAAKLQQIGNITFESLHALEKVFLYGEKAKAPFGAKIGAFPTKPTQKLVADIMPALDDLMARVEEARGARVGLKTAQRTLALHQFADVFIARYEAAKQARGWLDFDDLILKTRTLLSDKNVAEWVLYRIDGGIDHILVDEAQDTSPRQWDVIEKLTDEFYSGTGARPDVERTLFVVGDKKQSIYSFQGADPEEFDRKAIEFERKVRDAQQAFFQRSLDYSFRSSTAILDTVDQTFEHAGQDTFDKQSQHIAFKSDLPGRVDLWPVVPKAEAEPDLEWDDPLDRRSDAHQDVVLANHIAATIKELTENAHTIPEDSSTPGKFVKRRIEPGDFLILVQSRGGIFNEIIRACKAANLPIAGADRLKVGGEMAVKDLAALLSFLATPDDSLSLATVLKSPLFGWSEQRLFTLAHHRAPNDSLWQSLRGQPDSYGHENAVLRDLRGQVDFLRPYDLIERILTRHHGRAHLLSRLGPEAEDGINAMLTQALAYERSDVPSLTGFLQWMETDDLEIKRQVDSSSNQIRVMTVHGAKGLEAPIVILPDTGPKKNDIKDDIIRLRDVPVWKPPAAEMPETAAHRLEEMKAAQMRERLRLLYVAMTRAERWLIIAAAGDLGKEATDWYQTIQSALGHMNATEVGTEGILRYAQGDWDALPLKEETENKAKSAILEPVFRTPATTPPEKRNTLSPSDLGGAKALGGEAGQDEDAAKSYGSLVHLLLENLDSTTPAARHAATQKYTAEWGADLMAAALAEASQVLDAPTHAALFAPNTLAEVPITATIGTRRLHGIIDRLIITDTQVLAVDYKTNRNVPDTAQDCPEGLLRQMGAYAAMLRQLYPNQQVETAILWTYQNTLMLLPHDLVTQALWASPYLDALHPDT